MLLGNFFVGMQERVCGDDPLALSGDFLQQEANRHEVVFHAGAKHFFGLREDTRDLMQARDVVLVELDAAERRGEGEISELHVRAAHLADRHLEVLESVVFVALLEGSDQEIVGKQVLLGEAGGGDCLEASQEILVRGMLALGFGQ